MVVPGDGEPGRAASGGVRACPGECGGDGRLLLSRRSAGFVGPEEIEGRFGPYRSALELSMFSCTRASRYKGSHCLLTSSCWSLTGQESFCDKSAHKSHDASCSCGPCYGLDSHVPMSTSGSRKTGNPCMVVDEPTGDSTKLESREGRLSDGAWNVPRFVVSETYALTCEQ